MNNLYRVKITGYGAYDEEHKNPRSFELLLFAEEIDEATYLTQESLHGEGEYNVWLFNTSAWRDPKLIESIEIVPIDDISSRVLLINETTNKKK